MEINNAFKKMTKKPMRHVLFLMVMVLLVGFAESPRTSAEEFHPSTRYTIMNLEDKTAVAPSFWGGTGINLTVKENGVNIEYDCAEAVINEKLLIDEQGSFDVEGTYKRRSPGALRVGFEPQGKAARFVGNISDKRMTLKVTLTEDDDEIGDFTLERDKETRLRRCR